MQYQSTILIVDDQANAREILKEALAEEGYNLAFAENGPEALTKAVELRPDLILLDVMMPEMDGFEVCRRLRSGPLKAEVSVIMITALDDNDSLIQGIEAGADDFISKPFNRAELQARVRTVTRLDRYRRLLSERIQRQQAEQEVYRRNRELTLLNQVIQAAASTLDVQGILQIACEALSHTLELPHATGLLLDKASNQFMVEVEYLSTESMTAPPDQKASQPATPAQNLALTPSLLAYLLRYKTLLALVDGRINPQLADFQEVMRQHRLGTLLVVPILLRDQVVGLIELQAIERRHFDNQNLNLALSISTAVGQAMETAQLYQSLQRHADHLEDMVAQRTHELQSERDRTQAILEAVGEGVVVTDLTGTIQYLNPSAVALTGFTGPEAVGQSWRLWQNDQQSADFYANIEQAIKAGQIWRGEVIFKNKAGTPYDAALTVAPLFEPFNQTQPIGFVSVQHNITPLKETERLKDQFISNVSHELSTPLTVMSLLVDNFEMLYERLSEEKRQKMIQDIKKHMRILNNMADSILEISRLDSDHVSMKSQVINLAQLTREEVEKQLPLAQQKEQTLHAHGLERLTVWGDDDYLRQVVRNLVNNAIKYTPKGGQISCQFEIIALSGLESNGKNSEWPESASLPPGDWAALRVVDTGIGISQKDLPHLFKRFYRVKIQDNIRGTGLGLSIVHKLVELHQGRLAVASTPGQGSVFAIYLPLLKKE